MLGCLSLVVAFQSLISWTKGLGVTRLTGERSFDSNRTIGAAFCAPVVVALIRLGLFHLIKGTIPSALPARVLCVGDVKILLSLSWCAENKPCRDEIPVFQQFSMKDIF